MDGHKPWIKRGLDDSVFLVARSLEPGFEGWHCGSSYGTHDLETRVNEDPFVAEKVVDAEFVEISPAKADERLQFLLN